MASSDRQIVACLFLSLRFVFLTFGPWLAHVLIADVLLSCLLPFAFIFPTYTYHLGSIIAESVWRGVQRICEDSNGADIILAGDELPAGESAILVANHVEWSDFYLVQALAIRTGMLGHCRWFAKNTLKWVPVLGWGLMVMGMPLVSRKWSEDKEELERLFSGIKERGWPICKRHLRTSGLYRDD
jgi:1-acyl-sn-glycerol-3-phosphate acyltransferase